MQKSGYAALCCTLAAALLTTTPALADRQAPDTYWQESWQCGQEANPIREMVQMLIESGSLRGYTVNGVTLPILVGQRLEQLGTVVFIQEGDQWHTYPVAAGHEVEGIYSTPAYDRIMLFSMWAIEGPGDEYTVLRGKKQLASIDCLKMGFPKDLNQPLWASEYLSLHDFNIDKDGNGALIGVANLERDGHEQQRFYQYTTRDWGKTWGKPTPIKSPAAKLPGVFQPAKETVPAPQLLDSLRRSLDQGTNSTRIGV